MDNKDVSTTNDKGEKLKNYKCRICSEVYRLSSRDNQIRNKTASKRTCFNPDCLFKAWELFKEKTQKDKIKAVNKRLKKEREDFIKKEGIDLSRGKKSKKHQEPLQKAVNKLARLLDKDKKCIVYRHYAPLQAGHSIGVGANKTLCYLLLNIHGESQISNKNQNIPDIVRIDAMALRYGEDAKDALMQIKRDTKSINLNGMQKKEKLKIVNRLIRELEGGAIYTRRYCDEQIGIYELPDNYRI